MKNIIRIPLLLVYVVALLALYIFSVDKYSWMREMDPALSPKAINHDASNQFLMASLIFIFILLMQFTLFLREQQAKWKIAAVGLMLIAVLIYIAGYFHRL